MKLKIEKSWEQWFRTGYLYRVSSIDPYDAGGYIAYKNHLFDEIQAENWDHRSHLKPHLREWLEDALPHSHWQAEHPSRQGWIKDLGILFSRKSDIVLFKMALV